MIVLRFVLLLLLGALVWPALAHAQAAPGGGGGLVPCDRCEIPQLADVAVNIFNWLIKIGGAATVLAMVIAGARYIVAVLQGADSSAISAAKESLGYAIMGTIILLTAYVIVNTIYRVIFGGTVSVPGL